MPVRRSSNAQWIQRVWDAIRSANSQKQMADMARIVKYLQRVENCSQSEAELHVNQALEDGLIISQQKVTAKGSKVGSQVESFKIPMQEQPVPVDDGNDWYCIDCHLGGDVTPCSSCFRVFHKSCGLVGKKAVNNCSGNISFDNNQKRMSYLSNASCSPIIKKESNSNHRNFTNVTMDKLDESLSVIVDNVERRLEKMEESDRIGNESTNNIIIQNLSNTEGYDETCCSICNMFRIEPSIVLKKDEFNYLLTFVYSRICSWLPRIVTDKMLPEETKLEWLTTPEVKWRSQQLFYLPMDMNVIKSKLDSKEYSSIGEFKADVLTIQHNVFIYHGGESQEVGAAEYMWNDCCHDTAEILNCVDCYKHSNEKVNNLWFCFPCRNPHKLVWAKQKGYPYWPAKVIKETESTCDVRFFGGKYERSVLPKYHIKPININKNDMKIKKSSAFNKAMEELVIHQKMLNNPTEIEKYKSLSRKRKSLNKSSTTTIPSKISKPNPPKIKISKMSEFDIYEFDDFSPNSTASSLQESPRVPKKKISLKTSTPRGAKPMALVQTHRTRSSFSKTTPVKDFEELSNFNSDFKKRTDGNNEEVSSSTEQVRMLEETCTRDSSDALMPQTDRQYSESVEKTRRKLEQCNDKQQLINVALECMQAEIDRINTEHDEYLKKVFEVHNNQISETKKKQWCYYCEQDAIYHCCWNTAYCSPMCQQQHWQAEHKKVCRRKR